MLRIQRYLFTTRKECVSDLSKYIDGTIGPVVIGRCHVTHSHVVVYNTVRPT